MAKLNFIIACDNAEVSQPHQKLNISGIFDSIYSEGFPAVHKSVTVVVHFEAGLGKHKYYFKIVKDEQAVVDLPEQEVEIVKPRHQFIHRINNLPLPDEGQYWIEVFLDGTKLGSSYFMARRIPN